MLVLLLLIALGLCVLAGLLVAAAGPARAVAERRWFERARQKGALPASGPQPALARKRVTRVPPSRAA